MYGYERYLCVTNVCLQSIIGFDGFYFLIINYKKYAAMFDAMQ